MKLFVSLVVSTLLLAQNVAASACPTNCGHRGTGRSVAGGPFPENTVESFQQAMLELCCPCQMKPRCLRAFGRLHPKI